MSSQNRRWPVVPVAVVGAFLFGMAVRGLASPGATAGQPCRSVPAEPQIVENPEPIEAGPVGVESGIPVGYARTREGAVAAAVSYVSTGQAILGMAPAEVEAAVRTMATGDASEAILADTRARLAAARAALAGSDTSIEYRQAALAVRVDAFSQERARVAVWNIGILSREGVAPPQAGWAISTFDLAWERNDWKVASEAIEPGPAPVTNAAVAPATSAEVRRRLVGFAAYGSRS